MRTGFSNDDGIWVWDMDDGTSTFHTVPVSSTIDSNRKILVLRWAIVVGGLPVVRSKHRVGLLSRFTSA